jgi:hypothetical protein
VPALRKLDPKTSPLASSIRCEYAVVSVIRAPDYWKATAKRLPAASDIDRIEVEAERESATVPYLEVHCAD